MRGCRQLSYHFSLFLAGILPPQPPRHRGGKTPNPPDIGRAVSFKLITADFESINLTEDSQVYLFLIKRVSHNN